MNEKTQRLTSRRAITSPVLGLGDAVAKGWARRSTITELIPRHASARELCRPPRACREVEQTDTIMLVVAHPASILYLRGRP
jgi:hypothetical protein